jgi:hypothetical protein
MNTFQSENIKERGHFGELNVDGGNNIKVERKDVFYENAD